MIDSQIRVGIAGLGKMGLVHAGILNGLLGSRVVAAADPSKWARSALGELTGSVEMFTDAEDMIRSAELDAVVIATPVDQHVPMCMACVERRLPFFVEKPLTTQAGQAEELVQQLRERRMAHMVGYMTRYVDSFVKGHELVRSGCLGRIQRVTATIYVSQLFRRGKGWRYDKTLSGGGVLLSQGSHLLDLLTWYLGPVARVNGRVQSVYSREVEDFAHIFLEFSSGVTGWVDSSWSVRFRRTVEITIELQGVDGNLIVTDDTVRLYLERGFGELSPGGNVWNAVDLYRPVEFDIGCPQYTREDAAFLDAVRMGRPGDIDMDQAIHVQRIVDAAYTSSAANGAPEEVST